MLEKTKVLSGSQFTGGESAGLFYKKTGANKIQIILHSISFNTSAACSYSLKLKDPTNVSNETLIISGSASSFYLSNILLPTEDKYAWKLVFETYTMADDGYLNIDFDFIGSPG